MAEYGSEWDVVDEQPFDASAFYFSQVPAPEPTSQLGGWDVVDEQPIEGFDFTPAQPAAPQKEFSFLDDAVLTGKAIGSGLYSAVADVFPKTVAEVYRGGDMPLHPTDWAGRTIKEQTADLKARELPPEEANRELFGVIKAKDVQSGLSNLGYSAGSMAAGFGAGALAGSVVPGPGTAAGAIAGAVGSGAAGFATGYRSAADQFVEDIRQRALALDPNMTEEKWGEIKQAISGDKTLYGLWEAVPEALGEALTMGLIKTPAGKIVKEIPFIKNNVARFAAGAATKIGIDVPVELAGETATQMGQTAVSAPYTGEKAQSFGEALDDVGPQTVVMTLATLGLGGLAERYTPSSVRSREATQAIHNLVGDNQHTLLNDNELATAEQAASYLLRDHPSIEARDSLQAIQAEREARSLNQQGQQEAQAGTEAQGQSQSPLLPPQVELPLSAPGKPPVEISERNIFDAPNPPMSQDQGALASEVTASEASPISQHIAQGGGVDLLSGKPVGYGLGTAEASNLLTPEEQARADTIRQELETPSAAVPQGQGFDLVGKPQDFSQAEATAVEVPPFTPEVQAEVTQRKQQLQNLTTLLANERNQKAREQTTATMQVVQDRLDVLTDKYGQLNGNNLVNKDQTSINNNDLINQQSDSRWLIDPSKVKGTAAKSLFGFLKKAGVDTVFPTSDWSEKQVGLVKFESQHNRVEARLPSGDGVKFHTLEGELVPVSMKVDGKYYPVDKQNMKRFANDIKKLSAFLGIESGDYSKPALSIPGATAATGPVTEAEGLGPLNSDGKMAGDVPRYKISSPKGRIAPAENWRGHTVEDLKRAFPKSRIAETETGHRIDLPNRRAILVDRAGFIQIDPEAARRGGYSEEAIAKATETGAKGQFNMVAGTGVIQLTEAGRGELGHEVMHFARVAALTPKQNALLDRKYGVEARDENHREELIAQAYNSWLNKRGADSTGMFAPILKFFRNIRQAIAPTSEGVFEKVASGKAWSQETGQAGQAGPQYQVGYHGSPHRGIERFDWEKHKGNGEGAAAFGAGTYFTQKKEVGDWYTGNLGVGGASVPTYYEVRGVQTKPGSPEQKAADLIFSAGSAKAKSISKSMLSDAKNGSEWTLDKGLQYYEKINELTHSLSKKDVKKAKGQLYEVDIPEADDLLDWDKPISEQPEGVREKLEKLRDLYKSMNPKSNALDGDMRFGQFYNLASAPEYAGSAENVSRDLKAVGIPGHQYLDGMSRGKGEGSHNFVIYDDNRIKITNTFYSLADTAGATASEVEDARRQWVEKGTDSPYFKKWLGDSEYLGIMLHGSPNNNLKTIKSPSKPWIAAFLAPMDASGSELASHFSGKNEGASVYPVHAKAKKIFDADNKDDVSKLKATYRTIPEIKGRSDWTILEQERIVSRLKELGYDAMYVNEGYAGGPENIAIFYPTQIKSATGNRGTFSGKNADIRYALPKTKEEQLAQARERLAKALKGTIIRAEDGIAADPAKLPMSKESVTAWLQRQYQDYVDQYAPVLREAGKLSKEAKDHLQNLISFLRGGGGAVDEILTGKGEIRNYAAADPSTNVPNSKSLAAVLAPLKGDPQMAEAFDLLLKGEWQIALAKYRPEIARKDYLADRKFWLDALKEAQNAQERKLIRGQLKAIKEAFVRQVKGVDAAYWTKRIPEVETTLGPEKTAEVRRAMKDYRDFLGHAVLDRLHEAGTLSKEAYAKIKNAPEHEWYAPMQRQMDQIDQAQAQFVGHRDVIQRLKGSLRNTLPAVESAIAYVDRSVRLVAQNNVAKAFLAVREAKPDLAALIREVQVDPARVSGDRYIRVIEDGKKKFYEAPKEFVQALNGITPGEATLFKQIMAIPAKALRFGATMSLEFPVRNFMRDQWSAMINSNYGYMPFVGALDGMRRIAMNDKTVAEWKAAGGDQAYFTSLDRSVKHIQAKELMGLQEKGLVKYFKNPKELAGAIAGGLRSVSDFAEKGTRVGLYANARKKGATPGEAATEARMSTLDFGRMGLSGRAVNSIIAFWNANVQDVDILARNLRDKPGRTLAKIALGVTLPSVLLWAAQHDDDRYKSTPQWLKDTFWVIYPWWDKKATVPLILPKPFLMGALFGSSVEHMLDFAVDKKRDGLKDAVRAVVTVGGPGFMPTLFGPYLEWKTNYSIFRGRSLESQADQKLPPSMRANTQTQEIYKKLGNLIDVSPIKLENTVRGYTGNLGLAATAAMSAGIKAVDGKERPTEVAQRLTEQPGIKAVFGREPIGGNSQQVVDFYDNLERASQAEAGLKVLAGSGDKAAMVKFRDENKADIATSDVLQKTARELSEIRKSIAAIQKHPTMAPEMKRQRMDQLNRTMTKVAGQANAIYEKRKAGK